MAGGVEVDAAGTALDLEHVAEGEGVVLAVGVVHGAEDHDVVGGKIHSPGEGLRADEEAEAALEKGVLDKGAVGAGEAGVVDADAAGEAEGEGGGASSPGGRVAAGEEGGDPEALVAGGDEYEGLAGKRKELLDEDLVEVVDFHEFVFAVGAVFSVP